MKFIARIKKKVGRVKEDSIWIGIKMTWEEFFSLPKKIFRKLSSKQE